MALLLLSLLPLLASADVHKMQLLQQRSILASLHGRVNDKATEKMTDEQLVKFVNNKQAFWKAELHPRFSSYEGSVRAGLMGVEHVGLPQSAKKTLSATRHLNISIPDSFDSREWWPECASIKHVRDQSSCGSCWAFGAAEAISDRMCVASKGKVQISVSTNDLLSCCHTCGFGCRGGYPIEAWKYWVEQGIVSGSDFEDKSGCKPYPFPPCHHKNANGTSFDACKGGMFSTPQCSRKCDGNSTREYKKDKHFGLTAYGVEATEESIQKELMTYGPVEVAFEVYSDFFHYKEGVYMRTGGQLAGGHAVKLIGWGVEGNVPYWLLVNSWNEDWGDKGYFKVVRGINECGIESGVVAGIPQVRTEDL